MRWNGSTINGNAERGYGILLNQLYRGRIVWNRVTVVRDPDSGKRVSRVNPEAEWQSADAPHLAIVDPETWAAAQARKLAKAHQHVERRDQTPKRPFSGLLRCGACGGGMALHDRSGSAVRIRCSTARESGSCDNTGRYRLDKIEAAIIGRLREQLAHPALLREYLRVYREERRASIAAATRDRTALEREVATATGQLDRMLGLYSRGVIDGESAERQISDLQANLNDAKARLRKASEAVPVVELHPDAVNRYARTLETLGARLALPDPSYDTATIDCLRQIVARVIVHPPAGTNTAVIEVIAWLEALTGENPERVGG